MPEKISPLDTTCRIFFGMIGATLLGGGLLHKFKVLPFNQSGDLIFMPEMVGMGTYPSIPETEWSSFFLHIMIVQGILYARTAYFADRRLAEYPKQ